VLGVDVPFLLTGEKEIREGTADGVCNFLGEIGRASCRERV
jgi:hypothetical protein